MPPQMPPQAMGGFMMPQMQAQPPQPPSAPHPPPRVSNGLQDRCCSLVHKDHKYYKNVKPD